MRVAVLSGGRSGEHEVSLSSGAAVRAGVEDAGHEVVDVRLARDGRWLADGSEILLAAGGGLLDCDVAWPALHGPFGEDGTVQGMLELLGVPYVGAGVTASAVCLDKVVSKQLLAAADFPQVGFGAVRIDDWETAPGEVLERLEVLGTPTFVKPARLGSSVGIAKVGEGGLEMADALTAAFDHDRLVIVEAASSGIEVECAVLGNAHPDVSVPGEIVLPDADWYDYEAKYTDGGMELVVPARLPDAVLEEVRRLAREVFEFVRCAGLARVDFFVEGERVLVNELNTMPGFTPTSVYPKLWAASGIAFPELCDRLLRLALER